MFVGSNTLSTPIFLNSWIAIGAVMSFCQHQIQIAFDKLPRNDLIKAGVGGKDLFSHGHRTCHMRSFSCDSFCANGKLNQYSASTIQEHFQVHQRSKIKRYLSERS